VFRYISAGGDPARQGRPGIPGTIVDVRRAPGFWGGVVAVGTIHHVAFRARDDATQLVLREQLARQGLNVTPVIDRQYFHSVYFREPGGVLFEIATDPPGFTIDEPLDELGSHLKLPPWLEGVRNELERVLPPLTRPTPSGTAEGDVEPEADIEVRDPSIYATSFDWRCQSAAVCFSGVHQDVSHSTWWIGVAAGRRSDEPWARIACIASTSMRLAHNS